MSELIEAGYGDIKVTETREGHIGQSLLAKEHFQHYMAVADFLSKSSMVPKGMMNKPADILIAMEMGLQIGIPMMQAIQDIAVINGKPCMYGDGLLAVVQGHKDFEWINEEITKDAGDKQSAICTIKRRNHEPHSVLFSVSDAKKASLWGKQGPWSQYPLRMLQMRARGFCIRDIFADALRGIKTDEEVNDYQNDKPKKPTLSNSLQNILDAKARHHPEADIKETIIMSTDEQREIIQALFATKDIVNERLKAAVERYNSTSWNELTLDKADQMIAALHKQPDKE